MAAERITKGPPLSTKGPSADPHHPRSLIRSAGIMGLATGLSRVLGFIRDWLIALTYGTSFTAQAFVVAFRIPNLFRDLVAEGAANAAFVPVFSRVRAREGEGSWRALAHAVWGRLVIGFALLCVLGVLAAPWLVRAIAPGFRSDPQLTRLTVDLTRILFPFIGVVGAAGFFMGLLNSIHQFALPSLGPVFFNMGMIAGILLWSEGARGLAWGAIAGGILQVLIQVPSVRRAGVDLTVRIRSHAGVRQISRMMTPRIAGGAVHQVSVLVDTVFASFAHLVGAGGVAALYFANRFLQMPLAIFGISMAQAALPTLSAQVEAEDLPAARRTLALALRASVMVALPATVGLIALGRPIIQVLLEHGEFSAQATHMTTRALQWYALGLCSFCVVKVLANALYAFHDTWTPVRSAAAALAVNVILNALLIRPMGLSGLALATSAAATQNALDLYAAVRRRLGPAPAGFGGTVARMLAASLAMGLAARWIWAMGAARATASGAAAAAGWLLFTIAAAVTVLAGAALLLRIEEARRALEWVLAWNRRSAKG